MKCCTKCGDPIHTDSVLISKYCELAGMSGRQARYFIEKHCTEGIEYVEQGPKIWIHVDRAEDRRWTGLKLKTEKSESASIVNDELLQAMPQKRTSTKLAASAHN